jgi:hypothetical protein
MKVWMVERDRTLVSDIYSVRHNALYVINDTEEIPNGQMGWVYPPHEHKPRTALYDTDQFVSPGSGHSVGIVPGTWKLGNGLPGLRVIDAATIDSETHLLVIKDMVSVAWFAKVNGWHSGDGGPISAWPTDPLSGGRPYDGVTLTPEIGINIMSEQWTGLGGQNIGRLNIPDGVRISYTLAAMTMTASVNRQLIVDWWADDPIGTVKMYESPHSIPDGWRSHASLGGETAMERYS